MAGEITSAGMSIWYAPEAQLNTRPTTGWKKRPSTDYLNLAGYVTEISGMESDVEEVDVTPLEEEFRRITISGLMGSEGITLTINMNPTSRNSWEAICDEAEALTGGLSLWFQFVMKGDDQGFFVRGTPSRVKFPNARSGEALTQTVKISVSKWDDWDDAVTQ